MGTPVIVRSRGGFQVEVEAGTHRFIADEPAAVGGTDGGPTPYDLIAAGIGACTSMTLHFYARREHIPLDSVELEIVNDRMHAKDCIDCTTSQGYLHRFDVKIRLHGDLTPEQRETLLGIARRCPVYKTLTNEIRINEILVE